VNSVPYCTHVDATSLVISSSTDNHMKRQAWITLGVSYTRGCILICLFLELNATTNRINTNAFFRVVDVVRFQVRLIAWMATGS
jgi:hypothetical protein